MFEQVVKMDEALFLAINHDFGGPLTDAIMTLATAMGGPDVVIAFGLLFILMWESKKKKARMIAFILMMTVAGAGLFLAKDYFDRDRPLKRFKPEIASDAVSVRAPYHHLYSRSFPSGHSQAAFTVATFFALYYRRYRLLLFMAASMVALSRVFLGVHYPADIVIGAGYGAMIAWVFWRLDPAVKREKETINIASH